MRLMLLLLLVVASPAGFAQDTPLPRPRPAVESPAATASPPLPRTRPGAGPQTEAAPAAPAEEDSPAPPEPEAPAAPRIYQAACPAVITGLVEAEMLPPLSDGSCGERSPLAVTGVAANGRTVALSAAATLNCPMATALPGWVAAVDAYLWATENTRIARVLTGTSYMCRGRNRVVGADISEHGFANALDITGFELEDGRIVTLVGGWSAAQSAAGRLLRFAHGAGCARFSTTLGPEANALHADHLHLDLGCHGAACTARLCE